MQYYTMQDYVDLVVFLNRNVKRLNEEKEKYSAKEKIDNSSKHHKHDKIFKKILNNKKEIVMLINQQLEPKEKIKQEEIEKYETEYITRLYEERKTDKLEEKDLKKIKEIILKEEGDDGMSHVHEVLRKDAERERKKAIAEGLAEGTEKGITQGRTESLINVAKKMLKEKVDIDFIIKITGLKKEQILN